MAKLKREFYTKKLVDGTLRFWESPDNFIEGNRPILGKTKERLLRQTITATLNGTRQEPIMSYYGFAFGYTREEANSAYDLLKASYTDGTRPQAMDNPVYMVNWQTGEAIGIYSYLSDIVAVTKSSKPHIVNHLKGRRSRVKNYVLDADLDILYRKFCDIREKADLPLVGVWDATDFGMGGGLFDDLEVNNPLYYNVMALEQRLYDSITRIGGELNSGIKAGMEIELTPANLSRIGPIDFSMCDLEIRKGSGCGAEPTKIEVDRIEEEEDGSFTVYAKDEHTDD